MVMIDGECDNSIRILDCTLRDGGYYTDWHFDTALVKSYLKACSDARVSIVELGFRFRNPSVTSGKFAYSTDTMLKPLVEGSRFETAVMINAADFFTENAVDLQALRELFSRKDDSPIDWVRIAVKYDDFARTKSILNLLGDLGYKTGLNLMQAHNKTDQSYSEVASTIKEWKAADLLYFADSFGCMDANDISRIAGPFSSVFPGRVGFHSHNNRGLALANVL
jgi:4-hydroxy 2-oxovalerate aldolase